jgi:hypothetical protein
MRTFDQRRRGGAAADAPLIECGRKLLCTCALEGNDTRTDHLIYALEELIRLCFSGPEGSIAAIPFAARLRSKTADGMPSFLISEIVPALTEVQPELVLNSFFDPITDAVVVLQAEAPNMRDSLRLLDRVPTKVLNDWITEKPVPRASAIVPYITCVTPDVTGASWSERFSVAISQAAQPLDAFKAAEYQLLPSWIRGEVTSTVAVTKPLVQKLISDADVALAQWARGLIVRMDQAVEEEQERASRNAGRFE